MFKTHAGPVEGEGNDVYLRPETAQGHFVNFANVLQASRKSRRSASPRWASPSATRSRPGNFIFRTREFEQMEMEYFVPPDEGPKWFEYWCEERMRWYPDLGIPAEDLRLRHHDADELEPLLGRHRRRRVPLPLGASTSSRGSPTARDYDLNASTPTPRARSSDFFDQATETRYVPHVDRAGGRAPPGRSWPSCCRPTTRRR